MVTKNRCSRDNLQRVNYEIKADLMLITQNKMLPNLKSVPPEVSIRKVQNFKAKQRIIHFSKQKNKSVLSFLQEPLCIFQSNDKKRPKVYRLTYDKSNIKCQESTVRNKSESLKTSICDDFKHFYKSRKLQKTKNKSLPFPNIINLPYNKRTLYEEITDYNKNPSVSILKINSNARQKKNIHDQLCANIHSCANKQILLYKKKTTSYSTNSFLPATQNIFQEKQSKCTSYIYPTTSNPDHIQNKDPTKTSALVLLTTRTSISNNKSSSVMPLDRSIVCDIKKPNLSSDNYKKKKDGQVKDKMQLSVSENVVKTTNYDKKTLEMYQPKVINQSSSLEDRNVKRSMSAIHCKESTQCTYDIKNNISDLHISTNKCNSQKNKSRFNVQYSSDDIDWTSTSERDTYLTSKFETKSGYDCKIKYSWQVIGTSVQTSKILLYNFFEENKNQAHDYANQSSIYKCDVKYSWQIIGTGTQVSLQSSDNTDYWTGIVFKPNIQKNSKTITNGDKKEINNDIRLYKVQYGRKLLILNNQYTQTLTEKETQSDFTDCKVKYSWQNLVWQHL